MRFPAVFELLKVSLEAISALRAEQTLATCSRGNRDQRRDDDNRAADMLAAIYDKETGQRLVAERAFLKELDGSCETPIAGLSELDGSTMRLRGEVLRPDESEAIAADIKGAIEDGPAMGREMAAKLLADAGDGFFDWRIG